MVQQTGDNKFGVAKWIVDATASLGTHSTIASALTSASSGDTIFIRPGTYTENLTLKAGVSLTAFECDGAYGVVSGTPANNVTIIGKLTAGYTGTSSITGVRLQTNSDFCVVASGSNATVLNIFNCYINAENNTAISVTAANATVSLFYCNGNLATTGIAYFAQTAGNLLFLYCFMQNSGGSTTASTCSSASSGLADIIYCVFANPITASTGCTFNSHYSIFEGIGNTTCLTLGGTGGGLLDYCTFNSGSASAVSIGTGNTINMVHCSITSSNTNAITGAGTLTSVDLSFLGTSSKINTTTQTTYLMDLGKFVASGQPAFSANNAGANAVTGDGTAYTIGSSGTAWTEIYDRGSNFNTNGTFTAPSINGGTNVYHFIGSVGLTGIDATNTGVVPQIVTTARSYTGFTIAPFPVVVSGTLVLNFSCDADMSAGDTAVFQVTVYGASKNVNVQASATNTFFQGRLVC